MSFFRRRIVKAALAAVAIPVTAGVGLNTYVAYRAYTKLPEPQMKTLVTQDGRLILSDGETIKSPSTFQVVLRLFQIAFHFLPLLLEYLLFKPSPESYIQWVEKLLAAVEDAGPAFVKAGQWACTRNDLFSPEFRKVFSRLYSEVKTHPMEITQQIIEEDMGKPLDEVFSRFDPVPVGSGSIGQVHKAVLRNGREVAVKVMHPNVCEEIQMDFILINAAAKIVDKCVSGIAHLCVPMVAHAWTEHLAAQLDFRVEAENLQLFNIRFLGTDIVKFPTPYMSTRRVLVESFAEGHPATPEFLASQHDHARELIAQKGLNCWCKMILRDNLVHGDMHPGNILVDTSDPHHPEVTMIDVGLCQVLNKEESRVSWDMMRALVKWDAALYSSTLLDMGSFQTYVDKPLFHKHIADLFERWRPATDSDDEVVTNILQSVFDVVREDHVQMDPSYVNMMFGVLVLESFVMALNPDFNMVRHTAPWLVSEGHLSWGLIKNIANSNVDILKRRVVTAQYRFQDWMQGTNSLDQFEASHAPPVPLRQTHKPDINNPGEMFTAGMK